MALTAKQTTYFLRLLFPTSSAEPRARFLTDCQSNYGPSTITSFEGSSRPTTSQAVTMLDIGTRDIFNNNHDIFRTSVRKFFNEEIVPNLTQWQEVGHVPREAYLNAGNQKLLLIDTPKEYGGIGGDWLDACVSIEETAYANALGLGFGIGSHLVAPYIINFGTKEQIDELIPELAAGRKITALALTEPNAGSDLQGIQTYAKRDGDDWILNGSKVFISNGKIADFILVLAVTDFEAKNIAKGLSFFILKDGTPGFHKGQPLKKMGMKIMDCAELFFDNVRLPSSAVLGKENQAFSYLMKLLPQERTAVGIVGIAHAEWMFEETRRYVSQRKAFGKTLSQLQVVQHKLAEMKTEICIGRAFADQCIGLHHKNKLDSGMASMCKYWISDLQNRVAYDCVQLHGGWGCMEEFPISKAFVDARVQTIYGGTNEIMKELIARQIVSDKRIK